jgi:hypothetical protein
MLKYAKAEMIQKKTAKLRCSGAMPLEAAVTRGVIAHYAIATAEQKDRGKAMNWHSPQR